MKFEKLEVGMKHQKGDVVLCGGYSLEITMKNRRSVVVHYFNTTMFGIDFIKSNVPSYGSVPNIDNYTSFRKADK